MAEDFPQIFWGSIPQQVYFSFLIKVLMDECSVERLEKAHARSIYNWPLVKAATECGCFHCLRIFPVREVEDALRENRVIEAWPGELETHDTALCPHCGIDSVIDNMSGFPLNQTFLSLMKEKYF